MNIYILKPTKESLNDTDIWDNYDILLSIVVRVKSQLRARVIASDNGGDEKSYFSSNPWLSTKLTSCKILKNEGNQCVLIKNFRNG